MRPQRPGRWILWPAVGFLPIVALFALRGPELGRALSEFPLAAALLCIVAHVASLACRCEAWRLAVNAIGLEAPPRASVHAASSAGFATGVLQGASTAPVRAAMLRKLAPAEAPPIDQALVAEVPVILVDAALTAIVFAFAVVVASVAPPWVAALAVVATIALLAGLRILVLRYGDSRTVAGLRVLTQPRRLLPLTALVGATMAFGLLRVWVALAGFGLPHDPVHVAALFAALAAFGLLPIGASATPAATVAMLGSVDTTAAAAAGVAMSATSIVAVGVYGVTMLGALGAARALPGRPQTKSTSRVDQPNPRAASPAPVSGL